MPSLTGHVDEVADVLVMLAANGYIIGQTVNVNGGCYMTSQAVLRYFRAPTTTSWPKSLGAKSLRSRRHVCHSCAVPGDS